MTHDLEQINTASVAQFVELLDGTCDDTELSVQAFQNLLDQLATEHS